MSGLSRGQPFSFYPKPDRGRTGSILDAKTEILSRMETVLLRTTGIQDGEMIFPTWTKTVRFRTTGILDGKLNFPSRTKTVLSRMVRILDAKLSFPSRTEGIRFRRKGAATGLIARRAAARVLLCFPRDQSPRQICRTPSRRSCRARGTLLPGEPSPTRGGLPPGS